MISSEARLDSWKEISQYLKRDERTVQRWEQERNLPVHRPPGSKRSGVFAYPSELDHWLTQTSDLDLSNSLTHTPQSLAHNLDVVILADDKDGQKPEATDKHQSALDSGQVTGNRYRFMFFSLLPLCCQ